jgi:hypothetical protein
MDQQGELLDIATGMSWSERFDVSSRAALRGSSIKKIDARATFRVLTILRIVTTEFLVGVI